MGNINSQKKSKFIDIIKNNECSLAREILTEQNFLNEEYEVYSTSSYSYDETVKSTYLIQCIKFGQKEMFLLLLDFNADINKKEFKVTDELNERPQNYEELYIRRYIYNHTPIFYAISLNKVDFTKILIEKGARLSEPYEIEKIFQTYENSKESIEIYIKENVFRDGFIDNKSFFKIFDSILTSNCTEALKLLHNLGIELNVKDDNGESMLVKALNKVYRSYHFAEELNNLGAKFLPNDSKLIDKLPTKVNFLRKLGIPINSSGEDGSTPLHIACKSYDNIEDAIELIENGADVNAQDNYGHTPLIEAAKRADLPLIEYLIESAADINKVDEKGFDALIHASKGISSSSIIKCLIKKGASIHHKDKSGRSAVVWAIHYMFLDWVSMKYAPENLKAFLSLGIRPTYDECVSANASKMLGDCHLEHFPERLAIIKALRCDINLRDSHGMTGLIHAVKRNRSAEFILEFIKNGSAVDIVDNFGKTALNYAEDMNNEENKKILLNSFFHTCR